jgi:succinate dehydrogenase / fumarate reductase iron-sulfur subunit
MSKKIVVFRFDGAEDTEGRYDEFKIEEVPNMSVLDALNFIRTNLDSSLSFYGHSRCEHGICARCTVSVNGKNSVACRTILPSEDEVVIEPINKDKVLKDLVTGK